MKALDGASAQSSFKPGPMCFVEVLLVFSALYVLWWRLSGESRHTSASAPATGRTPGAVAIAGFTIGLAVVTYLRRIAMPTGASILRLPSPAYLPQYVALFALTRLSPQPSTRGGLRSAQTDHEQHRGADPGGDHVRRAAAGPRLPETSCQQGCWQESPFLDRKGLLSWSRLRESNP